MHGARELRRTLSPSHTRSIKEVSDMARSNMVRADGARDRGPKYPQVKIELPGPYGSFYATVAEVQTKMRLAGVPQKELSNFYEDVAEDDEENLLLGCLRWVNVDV
jgi:hypothetical protein